MFSVTTTFSYGREKLGLLSGYVLDLTEGYNLNKKLHREKARQTLEKNEPRLLVGTPRTKPVANLWRLSSHGTQSRGTSC